MSRRAVRLITPLLLVALGRVHAQERPSPQVGGFLQWTVFDNSLTIDDFFAVGGMVRMPLTHAFGVEADAARVVTNGPPTVEVSYVPLHARLTYTTPIRGRASAIVGAGYVHNWYGASRDASDGGVTGLMGMHFRINERIGARFDFLADYMPSPANVRPGVERNWNLGIRQGVVFNLRSGNRVTESVPIPTPKEAAPAPISDSDRDGIPDRSDRCSNTPAGTAVDASGCPLDSDGDGVPNRLDRCADTATGITVDASGCPLDSDRDGVTDQRDRCPNTPAGTAVDASGCALDSDSDGVPDNIDRCPTTPAGTKVNAAGCLQLFEENRKSLVLEGVNFANGKTDLTEESKTILNNVAASLVANKAVRVEVDGHTSTTGHRALNLRLSQARAEAVRTYLVVQGVASERLVARGFGPDRPVASNTTADGQAKNRRVELVKLD